MPSKTKIITSGARKFLIGQMILAATSFFTSAYLGRLLGPTNYGVLNLLLTIMTGFGIFTAMGMGPAVIYFYPKFYNKKPQFRNLIKKAFSFKLAWTFLLALFMFALAPNIGKIYALNPDYIRLFSVILFFYDLFIFLGDSFSAFQAFTFNMIKDITYALSKFLPLIALLAGFGFLGVLSGYFFVFLITVIVSLSLFLTRLLPKGAEKKTDFIPVLKYGAISMVVGLTFFVTTYMGNLVLGFYGKTLVGYFSAAMNFSALLIIFANAFVVPMRPVVSEIEFNKPHLNRVFKRVSKHVAQILVPIAFGMIVLAMPILKFTYGSEYTEYSAIIAFQIVILATIVSGVGKSLLITLYGLGKPGLVFISTFLQASLNLILSLALVPIYGVIGAGLSVLAVSFLEISANTVLLRRHFKFSYPINGLIKVLMSASVMAFAVLCIVKFTQGLIALVASTIIGAGIYFGMLYAIGGLDEEDFENLGLKKIMGLIGLRK